MAKPPLELVSVRGPARGTRPWFPSPLVAAPTLLAVFAAAFMVPLRVFPGALLAALALAVMGALGARATRFGRMLLAAPTFVVLLGALLGAAVGRFEVASCACFGGILALVGLASGTAPRGSAVKRPPREVFERPPSASSVALTLDRGGLRVDHGNRRSYVPFVELAVPRITRIGDASFLVVTDLFDALALSVRLESDAHLRSAEAVVAKIAAWQARPDSERGRAIPEGFARKGRSLEAWRRALDSLSADGYRTSGKEPSRLWALYEDDHAPVEVRAAAAYVLASSGAAGFDDHLTSDTPPLVFAMLAPFADVMGSVIAEHAVEARSYLAEEDAAARGRVGAPAGGSRVANGSIAEGEAHAGRESESESDRGSERDSESAHHRRRIDRPNDR